jgi:hypothetical protein
MSAAVLALFLAGTATASDPLETWLKGTPNGAAGAWPYSCPLQQATPSQPPFGFNFKPSELQGFSCLQDGPYRWKGNDWYVQRIKSSTITLVRVCSKNGAIEIAPKGIRSPCGTTTGPRGCAVCEP